MKRYFAFGCSFTNHSWASVADFIGVNFDEFRNLGVSGSSNTHMAERLLQANEKFNFTKNDFVTVGTTGIGRFSYIDKHSLDWTHYGDIFHSWPEHPRLSKVWANEFDSKYFAAYRSTIAIKCIRLLLESFGVKYRIYGAVNNLNFIDDQECKSFLKEFYRLHDIADTIDEHVVRTRQSNEVSGYRFENNYVDTHPSQLQHYRYFKQYFPEFDNEKTNEFFKTIETNLDLSDNQAQAGKWYDFRLSQQNYKLITKL
jgi:hypothetical protein